MTLSRKWITPRIPVLPVLAALLLGPLASVAVPDPAEAAACGMRKDLVSYLTRRYKEHPRAIGLVSKNSVLEVMVSKKGTWSILVTMTDGRTCIVAAGQNWEDVKSAIKDPAA